MSGSDVEAAAAIYRALMADPLKRAQVQQFLAGKQPTPVQRVKQPPRCESPTALHRRRQLEKITAKRDSTPDSSTSEKAQTVNSALSEAPLKGVIAFVEVKRKNEDRSASIKAIMKLMGATVRDEFTKDVTHVVFKDGSYMTYQRAKLLKVHLVSVLWLDAVKRNKYLVPEKNYPAFGIDLFDSDSCSRFCSQLQKDFDDVVRGETRRSLSTVLAKKPETGKIAALPSETDSFYSADKSSSSSHISEPNYSPPAECFVEASPPEMTSDESDCGAVVSEHNSKHLKKKFSQCSEKIPNAENSFKKKSIDVLSNVDLTEIFDNEPRNQIKKIASNAPMPFYTTINSMSSLRLSPLELTSKSKNISGDTSKENDSSVLNLPEKKNGKRYSEPENKRRNREVHDDSESEEGTKRSKSVNLKSEQNVRMTRSVSLSKSEPRNNLRKSRKSTKYNESDSGQEPTNKQKNKRKKRDSENERETISSTRSRSTCSNNSESSVKVRETSKNNESDSDEESTNEFENESIRRQENNREPKKRTIGSQSEPSKKMRKIRKSSKNNKSDSSEESASESGSVRKIIRTTRSRSIFSSKSESIKKVGKTSKNNESDSNEESMNDKSDREPKKEAVGSKKLSRASKFVRNNESDSNEESTNKWDLKGQEKKREFNREPKKRTIRSQSESNKKLRKTSKSPKNNKSDSNEESVSESVSERKTIRTTRSGSIFSSKSEPSKKIGKTSKNNEFDSDEESMNNESDSEPKKRTVRSEKLASAGKSTKSSESASENEPLIKYVTPKKNKTNRKPINNQRESKKIENKSRRRLLYNPNDLLENANQVSTSDEFERSERIKTKPANNSNNDVFINPNVVLRKINTINNQNVDKNPVIESRTNNINDNDDEQADLARELLNPFKTVNKSQGISKRKTSLDFTYLSQSQKKSKLKRRPGISCTKFHRNEYRRFEETVKTLGGFKVELNVTSQTTHLVAGEPLRTVNMLKAIAQGCWILKKEWLWQSSAKGKWLPEEEYEETDFSPLVQRCRLERQAFGPLYSMDIFGRCGLIYISPGTVPKSDDLKDLVCMCKGKVTNVVREAEIVVGQYVRYDAVVCVNELWILDSISRNKLKKFRNYLLKAPNF